MPDDERDEVIDRVRKRFDDPNTNETSETDQTSDPDAEMSETTGTAETIVTSETKEASRTADTSDTPAPGDEDFDLREHWNGRTIYLPDELVEDVDEVYGRYYARFKREHGRELKKNRDLYPAIFRAALHDTSIEEELGLEET